MSRHALLASISAAVFVLVVAGAVPNAAGQAMWVTPGLAVAASFSTTAMGVPGVPGGFDFDSAGTVFYMAGNAGSSGGVIYGLQPLRPPGGGHVTGFNSPYPSNNAPYIDAGLLFRFGGNLFWVTNPTDQLVQYSFPLVATMATNLPAPLSMTGGVCFAPGYLGGTSKVLVSS